MEQPQPEVRRLLGEEERRVIEEEDKQVVEEVENNQKSMVEKEGREGRSEEGAERWRKTSTDMVSFHSESKKDKIVEFVIDTPYVIYLNHVRA